MPKFILHQIYLSPEQKLYTLINGESGLQCPLVALWAYHLHQTVRPNTCKSYMEDLKLLLGWSFQRNIDLQLRLSSLKGLSQAEISDLTEHLATPKLGEPGRLAASTVNRRLVAVAEFMSYHADRYLHRTANNHERYRMGMDQTRRFLKSLKKHRRSKPEVALDEQVVSPLSQTAVIRILDIIHPDSPDNPYKSDAIKVRNYCMVLLSIEGLLRRSELVLLQTDDFSTGYNATITIKKPSPKNSLARKDGASIKTRGRQLPITSELAGWLNFFLDGSRQRLLNGRLSNSLFPSERTGKRLSAGAVNFLFPPIIKRYQEKHSETIAIHPHMLRVTGATEARKHLSSSISGRNVLSKTAEIQEILSYMGGWSQSSSMPRHYARAAIVENVNGAFRDKNQKD